MNRYYITTAIPYVNAKPHIGFALELIQADALARFHRRLNEEVRFLTGADENSLKNVQAAEQAGQATATFVGHMSGRFRELTKTLNISNEDFIRTTEERHKNGAQKLWRACKTEDIYRKSYSGLYCVGCEQYYSKKELVYGKCPEHKIKPEMVSEDNYFFKLSNYQATLEKLISSDKLKIIPVSRKNEMLSFIKQGLEDFSISRSRVRAKDWGVDVPDDPSQVMYVWFDALSNYINALGYADSGALYHKFWVDNANRVHVIGKGISRFHCIYWPAILLSAGLPLPSEIFVHGYVTVNNEKISKSLGNTVDPVELVSHYGAEPVRYYLLSEIPAYEDGDYSDAKFRQRYESDLANCLGNTFSRLTNMVEQYLNGRLPRKATGKEDIKKEVHDAMMRYRFDEALGYIWSSLRVISQDIDKTKPWELAKTGEAERLSGFLDLWCARFVSIVEELKPFMPSTAATIQQALSADKITKAEPLFPRLPQ